MKKTFVAKTLVNKKNNQISINIPKKLVKFKEVPKKLKVRVKW